MSREEILERLKEMLGEEQAAAVADALIGTEEPEPDGHDDQPSEAEAAAETEQSEDQPSEPEVDSEPEAEAEHEPEPEPEAESLPSEDLHAENERLRRKLGEAALKLAALSLGVAPERVNIVCRLAETGEFDPESEQAAQQAQEAVRRVLEEAPELAAGRGMPSTGSIGLHPRSIAQPTDPFAKGFFK